MSGLLQTLNSFGLPQEMILRITFYSIAGLTILAALLVVLSRDLFHSAMSLAVALIGIACVYLYLNAEFLAIAQILIYVGAVVTLFIFTIMFTSDIQKKIARVISRRAALSLLAVAVMLIGLVKIMRTANWQPAVESSVPFGLPELGRSLMNHYGLPFEVISVLSLAALIGALVLGKTEKK